MKLIWIGQENSLFLSIMQTNSYTIRPYKNGDEHSINRGFNEVFGQNRSMDEWYWKFGRDNDAASCIMLAVDGNDEVLVNFSTLPSRIQMNGKILTCAQAVDCYSLQREYVVRKKLYIATYKAYRAQFGAKENIALLYGCLGGRHLKLGRLVMNYTEPIPFTYLCKRMNLFHRARGLLMGQAVWRFICLRNRVDLNKAGDLWARSSGRYPVSVVRDDEYIFRRYLSHPVKKYYYLTVESKGVPDGFAVLSLNNRILKWLDLVWDGKDASTITELERRVWNLAVILGVKKVEMWLCNDEEVKETLKLSGMNESRNPYELFLTTTPLGPSVDSYELSRRIYFTMGDIDMF